jgi:hypothetical protein
MAPTQKIRPTLHSAPLSGLFLQRCQPAGSRSKQLFLCPITNYPCEGDLSYLCEEYGCARKGGLSPRSDENS